MKMSRLMNVTMTTIMELSASARRVTPTLTLPISIHG